MVDANDNRDAGHKLKCPECRAELKRRRSRKADACARWFAGDADRFLMCAIWTR